MGSLSIESNNSSRNQSLLRWIKKNISNDLELNLELDQLRLVTDCSPIELRIRQKKKSPKLCVVSSNLEFS